MILDSKKKGMVILDMIVIVVVLFVVAIGFIFGYMLLSDINTDFQADPDLSTEAKAVTGDFTDAYPSTFDFGFMMLIFGIWMFFLISTFFIDSHPIFFVVFLVLIIFVLITSVIMNNVWYEFITDSDMTIYETTFPMMSWYFDKILPIWIVIGMSSLVTLFIKSRSDSGGGY